MIATVAILSFSCKNRSQEKWRKDMEISTYYGGGMMPESKTVIIKDSSGTYIHWLQSKADTLSFTLSKQELDGLLKEINVNDFRSIFSGGMGSVAYDKPTTSVKFKWGNQFHEVSIGATEGIKKGDADSFYQLYNYILSLAMKKTGQATAN